MTRLVPLTVVLVFVSSLRNRVEPASLKVAPARFIVHDVKPGRLYDLHKETGLRLTIYNDDETTRTWVLSTHRPSERGRWEKGYAEIPDPRWCWFETSEIRVGPKRKEYANLYMEIPDKEKYYNQHWVVTIGIAGSPGRSGISLAVDVRVQIETLSKADGKALPDGLLGLKPSKVRFTNATPGTHEKASVVLYNNDDTTHSYAITSLFETVEMEPKTYLTQPHSAIPDSGWVKREKNVQIKAEGSAVLHLVLAIPKEPVYFGRKWEDILLVQPEDGLAGFIRVQVQTKERAKAD